MPRSKALVDYLREPRPHLGPVAVADRFDQQVAQRPALELQLRRARRRPGRRGLALLLELLEQPAVDLALARLVGDQVPEVADLGLADAVDAAEALLDAGSGSTAGRS